MIKNIILDMGNVLFDYNPQIPLNQYCETEEEREIIRRVLFEGPEWVLRDLGNITEEEARGQIEKRIAKELYQPLRNCMERWTDSMLPIKEAQEFVEYIMKQGYKVYVLSNASDAFYDYFPRFRPIEDFDGIVVSADIHMIKPDAGIYRYLTEKYNLESEECLFIDDRKENVDTALQLGWQAEVFEGDFEKIKEKYQL